jgi:DeoR/GlpR family transcriptional regulator of sugar metabolism
VWPVQHNIFRKCTASFALAVVAAVRDASKLTSSKCATIAKTSPDTALRDINDLVRRGLLEKDEGGGRSTSYSLIDTKQ